MRPKFIAINEGASNAASRKMVGLGRFELPTSALHVLSDLLGSVAAIAAAVVIITTGWMPIDPILSVVVAMLIFRSALYVVRHSAHILLEGTPDWLNVNEIRDRLMANLPDVTDVHHVHVWGLTQERLMLTMHVVLEESAASPTDTIRSVKKILADDYGIDHSTIEIETGACADSAHGRRGVAGIQ